jgi:hypothetical protein
LIFASLAMLAIATVPFVDCINCQAEELQVVRHEEHRQQATWIATTLYVECAACGHKFQLSVIPEA